jgi:DNA polymerase III epsilon subunit-like protein
VIVKTAIIFDCEFLCLEGSQRRFWCAAHDPDPVIAQIGAVMLGLEGDFPLLGTHKAYIRPVDRFGQRYTLDPFFTKLTGITEEDLEIEGVALENALADVDRFSGGSRFWSLGQGRIEHDRHQLLCRGHSASDPGHPV